MKLSIGDVVDRWSIAHLKFYRGKIDTLEEQRSYSDYYNSQGYDQKTIQDAFDELLRINGSIWSLESDIRLGKEGELGLEEVGRRALQIRDFNRERINIKNKLNERFNEGFIEEKANHASQK